MAEKIQSSDIKITPLSSSDVGELKSFCCGCKEMDDYIKTHLVVCSENHYFSAYVVRNISLNEVVAIFTLANDALIIQSEEDKNDVVVENSIISGSSYVDFFIEQMSFPAINIAHLAVVEKYQSCGIGSIIIEFVVNTFLNFRASGCQFVTVDALNDSRVIKFYTAKNKFIPLTNNDFYRETRRLYLPLDVFK